MESWQVTATTIYCDAVDDEVTLLVYKDKSAKCIAYRKYGEPDKEVDGLLKRKSKQLNRLLKCEGPECSRLVKYRDKLFSEECSKKEPEG